MLGLDLFSLLASLCEGGGPAGPEGESLAMTRNISGRRKVLSPTRCGGSPLPEGAKGGSFPSLHRLHIGVADFLRRAVAADVAMVYPDGAFAELLDLVDIMADKKQRCTAG